MEEIKKINTEIDNLLNGLEKAKRDRDREKVRELERKMDDLAIKGFKSATSEIIKSIINGEYKVLVISSEMLGKCLAWNGLTTSQIRNIFSEVKGMEMKGYAPETEKKLLLLKPKLAYAAGRPGAKQGTRELKDILTIAIDAVVESNDKEEEKFENFCKFFEAILAYHRAADGK